MTATTKDDGESIDIPEELAAKLRQAEAVRVSTMAELGRLYLEEKAARTRFEEAARDLAEITRAAQQVVWNHAKAQEHVLKEMKVADGSWDIDLEGGKLLRIDVGTGH